MSDLAAVLPVLQEEIEEENYTINLLALCSVYQLISEPQLAAIRRGLDEAFIEIAEQYTRRESSTLPKKIAEQLYASVLYQADVVLLPLKSVSKAIEMLKNTAIEKILEKGKRKILFLHRENKRIFQIAVKYQVHLPIYAYRYVMDKAFDEYWKGYSARFNAKDCCASIDYPLLGCFAYDLKSQGVLFMREYYTGIMYENLFCSLYDEKKIEIFLLDYGRQYRLNYEDMLCNLAELLLNNTLVNTLLHKPLYELSLSRSDINEFIVEFISYTEPELLAILRQALAEYREDININHNGCYAYVEKYLPILSKDLYVRIQNNTLENFLVITA